MNCDLYDFCGLTLQLVRTGSFVYGSSDTLASHLAASEMSDIILSAFFISLAAVKHRQSEPHADVKGREDEANGYERASMKPVDFVSLSSTGIFSNASTAQYERKVPQHVSTHRARLHSARTPHQ